MSETWCINCKLLPWVRRQSARLHKDSECLIATLLFSNAVAGNVLARGPHVTLCHFLLGPSSSSNRRFVLIFKGNVLKNVNVSISKKTTGLCGRKDLALSAVRPPENITFLEMTLVSKRLLTPALIHTHLLYGLVVWGSSYKSKLKNNYPFKTKQ